MSTATRATLSATTIIGDSVNNPQGENLGTIKDIMLDLDTGRVAYAVLSYGGFLGMGDKLFAVPWNAMRLDAPNHAFVLDVDQERLKEAEGFDPNEWPDMADQSWGRRLHDFYGAQPYWE
jgi:sporulation protein YlmC with PRC-barrel domain